MKKILLGLLSLFLVVGTMQAQDGKKALKKGLKALEKFSGALDAADQLEDGMAMLEMAMKDPVVSEDPKSFLKVGNVYSKIADAEIKTKLIQPDFQLSLPDASMKAFDAYKMALKMTDDKKINKSVLKALRPLEDHLNNTGIVFFEGKNYAKAFEYYNAAIGAYKLLKDNGAESKLDDEAVRNDHYFITAASGYYGEKMMESKPIFMELYNAESDKALVYEALFNIGQQEGDANAIKYLSKGRELFPDDTGLLFAEINYYLKEGKLEQLISKLETAKEKEPENNSIVVTLGNVYDQLSQKSREAGDQAKADEYFDKAFRYYEEALKNDPKNFDAAYSQGALYYNKAAGMTEAINAVAEDYSNEGTKKYNALKKEMEGYFDMALPYFLKAEAINEHDPNVLIALKEIYAKKNMMDKSEMYKTKLEAETGN